MRWSELHEGYVAVSDGNSQYANFDFGNGVEGFGTLRFDKGYAVIAHISVPEENRRKGLAGKAVAELEGIAREHGLQVIRGEAMLDSIPFWKAQGFTVPKSKDGKRPKISKRLVEGASPASRARELFIALGDKMGIEVDIALQDDREISLENIRVPEEKRRAGLASRFMRLLCDHCDEQGISMFVYAMPYEENMGGEQLRDFYKAFGFQNDEDVSGYMTRLA